MRPTTSGAFCAYLHPTLLPVPSPHRALRFDDRDPVVKESGLAFDFRSAHPLRDPDAQRLGRLGLHLPGWCATPAVKEPSAVAASSNPSQQSHDEGDRPSRDRRCGSAPRSDFVIDRSRQGGSFMFVSLPRSSTFAMHSFPPGVDSGFPVCYLP